MNFDRMRALLLEQAIRGELVPQLDSEGVVEQVGDAPEEIPFEIPQTWKWASVGSVVKLISGRDLAKEQIVDNEVATPYITGASQIHNNSVLVNRWTKSPAVLSEVGDVLLTCKGTVGKVAINNIGSIHIARQIMALRPAKCLEVYYLRFFLEYMGNSLSKNAKSMIPGIDRQTVLKTLIPLPTVAEQQRIVAKLEKAFAEIDRAEKAYQELQTLSDALTKQILQKAIQGRLVPQLESEPAVKTFVDEPVEVPFDIPKSWKWCHMKEITQKIHYGFTASAVNSGSARLLRITDIQDGRVNWKSVPFCDVPKNKLASYKLEENDVVIARTGGTIGKSILLTGVSDVAVFASYLIRLIPSTDIINPKYLMMFINSPEYWKQLKAMSQGTGQPNVNAKSLSTLLIPIPPIEEQYRIVQKLESLLSKVNELTNA